MRLSSVCSFCLLLRKAVVPRRVKQRERLLLNLKPLRRKGLVEENRRGYCFLSCKGRGKGAQPFLLLTESNLGLRLLQGLVKMQYVVNSC